MIRRCDGTDSNLQGEDGSPCDCGATFDDVDHLVIYPHSQITKPTAAQVEEWMRNLNT